MEEEMIDVEVNLGKELADRINKMSKKELLNNLVVTVLRSRVQDETVESLEKDNEALSKRLEKAESYVEQGRAMIDSVMERWYHYDS
jgi:hypothetical protein